MGKKLRRLPNPDDVAHGLIEAGCPLDPEAKYLVMVSGGPDSSFLLWALVHLGANVVAFHLDHAIREGSAADAEAAQRLAKKLGVPIEVVRLKPEVRPGASFETAARNIRYQEAKKAFARAGCDWILTAHTADDQIETFFINLRRGAGLDGLRGIPRRSDKVVRPILHLWKEDIRQALAAAGIEYVEDPTNLDVSLLRNKVRLQAIPALEEALGKGFKEALLRQTELLRDDADFLNSLAESEMKLHQKRLGDRPVLIFDAPWFTHLPLPIARRVIRIAFVKLTSNPPPPSRLVESALKVARRKGFADLGAGIVVSREGKHVVVRPASLEPPHKAAGKIPGAIEAPSFGVKIFARRVDLSSAHAEKLLGAPKTNEAMVSSEMEGPVIVRAPTPGERFRPYGLKGSKPLADFLAEKGLSKTERHFAPVLAKPDGTLVWVVGHRISEEAAVTSQDTHALHLVAEYLKGSETLPTDSTSSTESSNRGL